MADFTSSGWGAGATVTVYARDAFGNATGSSVTSATASAAGVASFTGLADSGKYVATDGSRTVKFGTPPASAPSESGVVAVDVTAAPYNAKGDGVTDDAPAFTAAFAAAITAKGTVHIPKPAVRYSLQTTVDVKPPGNSFVQVHVSAEGAFDAIQWDGGSGTDAARKQVFRIQGMKNSRWEGVKVNIPAGVTDVVAFECDNIDDTTGAFRSFSGNTFANCVVVGSTSGNDRCGGWRLGHVGASNVDISFINWENCATSIAPGAVTSGRPSGQGDPRTGTFHISNEGANSLNLVVNGGYAYHCDHAITNLSTTGATASTGGDSMFVYGFGTSGCNTDFQFRRAGNYAISGGRFEEGRRFLDFGVAGSTVSVSVSLTGGKIDGFSPADGILFNGLGGCALRVVGVAIGGTNASGTPVNWTAAMITLNGGTASAWGSLVVDSCRIAASTAGKFHTATVGHWSYDLRNNDAIDPATQGTVSKFTPIFWWSQADSLTFSIATGVEGGNVGTDCFLGFQPNDASSATVPRGRIGFRGGSSRFEITESQGRDWAVITSGIDTAIFRADGRTRTMRGRQIGRTVPGTFPYTALVTDEYVAVSTGVAGRSLVLPRASTVGAGHKVIIKDRSGGGATNTFTITPDATVPDTIDGAANKIINTNYGWYELVSDGTSNWEIISKG